MADSCTNYVISTLWKFYQSENISISPVLNFRQKSLGTTCGVQFAAYIITQKVEIFSICKQRARINVLSEDA